MAVIEYSPKDYQLKSMGDNICCIILSGTETPAQHNQVQGAIFLIVDGFESN